MRLETVKTEIQNLPYISFGEYYQDYVFQIQDSNIDDEMKFFMNHNFLSPKNISRAIEHVRKGMTKFD
jgi:hypothetical protein